MLLNGKQMNRRKNYEDVDSERGFEHEPFVSCFPHDSLQCYMITHVHVQYHNRICYYIHSRVKHKSIYFRPLSFVRSMFLLQFIRHLHGCVVSGRLDCNVMIKKCFLLKTRTGIQRLSFFFLTELENHQNIGVYFAPSVTLQ